MTSRVWGTLPAPGNGGSSASPDRVPRSDGGDRMASFTRRVEDWLATRPVAIVGALVADTKLSLRQVERNCKALYGISPKHLARRTRALRAAAAIHANPQDDYDVIAYGFYDQAHMIREVKKFTGMTPGQIRAGKQPCASAGRSDSGWAMSW